MSGFRSFTPIGWRGYSQDMIADLRHQDWVRFTKTGVRARYRVAAESKHIEDDEPLDEKPYDPADLQANRR